MKTAGSMFALMLLAALTLPTAPAFAQDSRHEVYVGVGDPSLIFDLHDATMTIVTLGAVTYEDAEGGPQVVAGYQYHLAPRLSVGATGSWASSKRTMLFLGYPVDRVERQIWTLMGDARFHWMNRPMVELYSGLGAGAAWLSDGYGHTGDITDVLLALQLNAIGVRVGRDWGGFAELGFGWNGIAKAGLSARF